MGAEGGGESEWVLKGRGGEVTGCMLKGGGGSEWVLKGSEWVLRGGGMKGKHAYHATFWMD